MSLAEEVPAPPDVRARAYALGRKEGMAQAVRDGRGNRKQPAKAPAFTAAARVINLADQAEKARIKKYGARAATSWQSEAWGYFDALPEVKNGARFKGRSLGKLRLFPAIQVAPDADPIPLDQVGEYEDAPELSDGVVRQCNDALERAGAGRGHATLLDRWGRNSFVGGEGYIVGYADPVSASGETFMLASPDEIRVDDRGNVALVLDPEDRPDDYIRLDPDTTVMVRVWNQHARYSNLPDSSVRGVLDVCERLLLLGNMVLGTGMSRMNNGILMFPNTMLKNARPPQGDATDGEALQDPIVADMLEHFLTPIGDPRSAAAAAPFIMTGDAEDIEKARWMKFDRDFDETADARLDGEINRLANGVDLPAEILTGFGETNHWTSWLIDDQTWKSYVQPDANEFVSALTLGYYRPILLAGGMSPALVSKMVVWYDNSQLVGDPDQTDVAFKAHEAGLLGDAPARQRLGYAEEEAPTAEDMARRIALRGDVRRDTVPPGDELVLPEAEPAVITPAEGDVTAAAVLDVGQVPEDVIIAAAATRRKLATLARKWSNRDRTLMDRLAAQSDATLLRALDKAGAKLRTKAIKASGAHADVVRAVPNREVAAMLGPGVITGSLELSVDELLDGSFDELIARYNAQVSRAQRLTYEDLEALGLSEDDLEEMAAGQDEDRRTGAAVLLGSITALATARLFSPNPNAPAAGEHDTTMSVPFGTVREALGRAGGNTGQVTPGGAFRTAHDDIEAGMVATGETTTKALGKLGIVTAGWVWRTGEPSRPFPPHEVLDGVEFSSWDDPVLANTGSFPDGPTFFPGDHAGCECGVEPIYSTRDDNALE